MCSTAILVGLLLLGSGLTAALDSGDFFEYPILAGTVRVVLAFLIIAAACPLLRLRAWGSVVIEAVAVLFLVCVVGFTAFFLWGAIHFAWRGAPGGMLMVVSGVSVMLFYAVPLVLAVRSLRGARLRGVLTGELPSTTSCRTAPLGAAGARREGGASCSLSLAPAPQVNWGCWTDKLGKDRKP